MTQRQELQVVLRTVAQTAGADQVSGSLNRVRQQAHQTSEEGGLREFFNQSSESALRFAGALTGVEIGLSVFASVGRAIREGLQASSEAFVESARVSRATAASYGANTDQFVRFAEALSAQTGFTRNSILDAALSARTLSTNYGLTIQQTQKLIAVSADLAQIRGIGVAEAFERVQSAIRGEAEASEFLGLTLNATFLQQNAANGAYRQTFTTLTDTQRAQVVYNELLRQTAGFTGLAASSTNTLEGAQRRSATATNELQRTFGELIAPAQTQLLRAQAQEFEHLADAIHKAQDASRDRPQGIASEEQRRQLQDQAEAVRAFNQAAAGGLAAGFAGTPLGQAIDVLRAANTVSKAIIPELRVASIANVTVISRSLQDIHDRSQQLATIAPLPFVGMDETAKSADLSVIRLRRDLDELQRTSSEASGLVTALGTSTSTASQRAALAAENDVRAILATTQAMAIATQSSLRAQESIASHISDPRDAIGGSNRVAQQRLALLDQLEPAEQALLNARQRQNDLTQESIRLQAQEAAQTLASLTTSEHLQDVQDRLRLDQLNLQLRGTLSPEQRTATRRDIRDINRRQLPQAERDALLAEIGLRPIQRAEGRTRLLGQIAGADVGAGQANLDAIIAQGVTAGITAAATKSPTQVNLHIDISGADGSSQVFDQLIEANGQAQTPPTIQVSAVRR